MSERVYLSITVNARSRAERIDEAVQQQHLSGPAVDDWVADSKLTRKQIIAAWVKHGGEDETDTGVFNGDGSFFEKTKWQGTSFGYSEWWSWLPDWLPEFAADVSSWPGVRDVAVHEEWREDGDGEATTTWERGVITQRLESRLVDTAIWDQHLPAAYRALDGNPSDEVDDLDLLVVALRNLVTALDPEGRHKPKPPPPPEAPAFFTIRSSAGDQRVEPSDPLYHRLLIAWREQYPAEEQP